MTTRITDSVKLDATHQLLADVAARYYLGCKTYHCTDKDTPERTHWHIRLKTLAQLGNQLADALIVTRPNWQVLYYTAHRYRRHDHNPFTRHDSDPAVVS